METNVFHDLYPHLNLYIFTVYSMHVLHRISHGARFPKFLKIRNPDSDSNMCNNQLFGHPDGHCAARKCEPGHHTKLAPDHILSRRVVGYHDFGVDILVQEIETSVAAAECGSVARDSPLVIAPCRCPVAATTTSPSQARQNTRGHEVVQGCFIVRWGCCTPYSANEGQLVCLLSWLLLFHASAVSKSRL